MLSFMATAYSTLTPIVHFPFKLDWDNVWQTNLTRRSRMPDDNVTSFPPTKPTIADIVNDGIKTGQTPNAIFATIGTLYPKKKMGEIMAAFEAEIDRQK